MRQLELRLMTRDGDGIRRRDVELEGAEIRSDKMERMKGRRFRARCKCGK